MISSNFLFFMVLCLSLLESSLSGPITENRNLDADAISLNNCGREARLNFEICILSHLSPENEILSIHNVSRCPTCANICRKSQIYLECAMNALDVFMTCNKNVGKDKLSFIRDILEGSVAFFCDDGGNKLGAFMEEDNQRCFRAGASECLINVMMHPENSEGGDNNSLGSAEEVKVLLCQHLTTRLSCVLRKTESCSQEISSLLRSYIDHLNNSHPCSENSIIDT